MVVAQKGSESSDHLTGTDRVPVLPLELEGTVVMQYFAPSNFVTRKDVAPSPDSLHTTAIS